MTLETRKSIEDLVQDCYNELPEWLKHEVDILTHITNVEYLIRKGKVYLGIYNTYSCWGQVYSGDTRVEEIAPEWIKEGNCPGGPANFSEKDFQKAGYQLVKEISSIADACKYPLDFYLKPEGSWSLCYTCKKGDSNLTIIEINRHPDGTNPLYSAQYVSITPGVVIRRLEIMDEKSGDDLSFVIPFLTKHSLVK
jgi:hypothetical protein